MTSTPSHALCFAFVQVFSPSCYYWSGIAEDGASEQCFAQVDVLLRCRYEDVKGFVGWSDGFVGFRDFIAGPGGVGGTRVIFGG